MKIMQIIKNPKNIKLKKYKNYEKKYIIIKHDILQV